MQDIFPDLGHGFVLACLRTFSGDPEAVIQHILEGSLPPSLAKLDTKLSTLPEDYGQAKKVEQNRAVDKGKGKVVVEEGEEEEGGESITDVLAKGQMDVSRKLKGGEGSSSAGSSRVPASSATGTASADNRPGLSGTVPPGFTSLSSNSTRRQSAASSDTGTTKSSASTLNSSQPSVVTSSAASSGPSGRFVRSKRSGDDVAVTDWTKAGAGGSKDAELVRRFALAAAERQWESELEYEDEYDDSYDDLMAVPGAGGDDGNESDEEDRKEAIRGGFTGRGGGQGGRGRGEGGRGGWDAGGRGGYDSSGRGRFDSGPSSAPGRQHPVSQGAAYDVVGPGRGSVPSRRDATGALGAGGGGGGRGGAGQGRGVLPVPDATPASGVPTVPAGSSAGGYPAASSGLGGRGAGAGGRGGGGSRHTPEWQRNSAPQFYVKDGKNYSYRVKGAVAVGSAGEAEELQRIQRETIHGLGRGGNRAAFAATRQDEDEEEEEEGEEGGGEGSGVEQGGGEGSGVGRGAGRGDRSHARKEQGKAWIGNHRRRDAAMKKHMRGLTGL